MGLKSCRTPLSPAFRGSRHALKLGSANSTAGVQRDAAVASEDAHPPPMMAPELVRPWIDDASAH
eukprot:8668815-Prorocentrum_lima.AAC.1